MSDIIPTFCGLTAEEIQELKQRNAELSAQVMQLRSAIKNTINKWEGVTELESRLTLYVLKRSYNKTSEQCLVEIKAQAVEEAIRNGITVDLVHYTIEQYANKIKSGEVEL